MKRAPWYSGWLCVIGLHKDRAVTVKPGFKIPENASIKDRFTLQTFDTLLSELQFWCDRCGKRTYA